MNKISGIINIAAAVLMSVLFIGTAAYGESSQARPAAAYTELSERKKVVACGTPVLKNVEPGTTLSPFGTLAGK